jgi:Na+-transporting methylmalonyl-CoA/oxaloacetate decarboxylase beta subunit
MDSEIFSFCEVLESCYLQKVFCLQVVQVIIYLALGSQLDISDPTNQPVAIILNNAALSLCVVTTIINVFINVFEVHDVKNV